MKAKDTVISKEHRIATGLGDLTENERWQRALELQAENSFKAGQKEMVDWIEEHNAAPYRPEIVIQQGDWRNKYKELGIEWE